MLIFKLSVLPEIITISRYKTPIGTMHGGSDSNGICVLEFCDDYINGNEFSLIIKKHNRKIKTGRNRYLDQLDQELSEYFGGQRMQFSVPLNLYGTTFQLSVWDILKEIPFGETWTYAQQAERYGNPLAIRAIAAANGKNPVSIIIPCHRVLGSDGSLTGYGGGLERKKWLLDFERELSGKPKQKIFDFK